MQSSCANSWQGQVSSQQLGSFDLCCLLFSQLQFPLLKMIIKLSLKTVSQAKRNQSQTNISYTVTRRTLHALACFWDTLLLCWWLPRMSTFPHVNSCKPWKQLTQSTHFCCFLQIYSQVSRVPSITVVASDSLSLVDLSWAHSRSLAMIKLRLVIFVKHLSCSLSQTSSPACFSRGFGRFQIKMFLDLHWFLLANPALLCFWGNATSEGSK